MLKVRYFTISMKLLANLFNWMAATLLRRVATGAENEVWKTK